MCKCAHAHTKGLTGALLFLPHERKIDWSNFMFNILFNTNKIASNLKVHVTYLLALEYSNWSTLASAEKASLCVCVHTVAYPGGLKVLEHPHQSPLERCFRTAQ